MNEIIGRVIDVEFIKHTKNGNPVYRVLIADAVGESWFMTAPDSMIAYAIANADYKSGKHLFRLDSKWRIYSIGRVNAG